MRGFSEGYRSFKEGLNTSLFVAYCHVIREHTWEILWGAGLLGIPFTLVTLYYSPSLRSLGWVLAVCVFIAGYYAWRSEHIRLIPRLRIAGTKFQDSPVTWGASVADYRAFVQLLPECMTESPVYECVGYLQRIDKRVGQDEWVATAIDTNLVLNWGDEKVELHPKAERPLNVFFIQRDTRQIVPCLKRDADIPSQKFDAELMNEPILRFYIQITCCDRINGDFVGIPPARICLEVRFVGPNRLRPQLQLIQV